ncbi:variant surface glycoprotein (VSG, atypical), putative [Trypanosoma brucei brucei TREU927]|uniref:Variant surface glycoprotein (VSG, atypical), putative n=1 Tax=Trypanosoma brucei brucei (strain 927/4 GUTat10.1) TaxID=185431 RepID=Q38CN1_TRYB2|nr:variant surface glycoprotein [Trypanosoma brucei brucei TREU927]EAN77439.1 variant surface glycoprotein (VSG, atypical), putative [Trypanosoma brucei brucei TREU927]
MQRLALALLVIIGPKLAAGENMVYGENRAEHAALCAFIRMADRAVAVPTVEPLDKDDYNYIQELNFTLSPAEWQAKFYKEAERKTVHDNADSAGIKDADEAEFWDDWKAAAEALKQGEDNQKVKQAVTPELTKTAKQLAAVQLAAIALEVKQLLKRYPNVNPEAAKYQSASPTAAIMAAALGQGDAKATNIDASKPFSATVSGNRQTVCEVKTSGVRPATALATLTCICHKDNGNPVTDGACTEKAEASTAWTSSATPPDSSDYQKLAKSCGAPPQEPITTTELEHAIATVRALIHTDGTNGYLGAFRGTDCSGASNSGMCIKFTGLVASPEKENELQWLTTIKTIATNLKHLEQAKAAAATAAISHSRALAAAMDKLSTKFSDSVETAINVRCETHNKSKTECLGAKCKWGGKKEDDGPCTPTEDQVAEQPARSTETEGAPKEGAAATGCARHGDDKTACENDKTGDKQNCAWRIGKDNEDDKEKEKFRSSSFLLNKQLALSMVAEFVSLIASQNLKIIRVLLIFMKIMNIS